MAETKYVIDASVAIKWIIDEPESEKALKIRRLYELDFADFLVPSFFFWEVCNVISKSCLEMTLPFLSELKMSDITECRLSHEQTLAALSLVKKYPKVSFYDASYHALALTEDATFITADKRYYDQTKSEGSIQLLKDFELA